MQKIAMFLLILASIFFKSGYSDELSTKINFTDGHEEKNLYVLSSLLFFLQSQIENIDRELKIKNSLTDEEEYPFIFDEKNVLALWEKMGSKENEFSYSKFFYDKYVEKMHANDLVEARCALFKAALMLQTVWLEKNGLSSTETLTQKIKQNEKLLKQPIDSSFALILINENQDCSEWINQGEVSKKSLGYTASHKQKDIDLRDNPYIPDSLKKEIKPFLLQPKEYRRRILDSIFKATRATLTDETLVNAGFKILYKQPRSYIRVVSHPRLQGYLLKLYLDSERKIKKNVAGCEWLIRRCKGAKRIKKVIIKNNIAHFLVPEKKIYPLPKEPSPPLNKKFKRQLILLVVQDMQLTSKTESYMAWKKFITPEHLKELYIIISHASATTYRPDNLPLTIYGKFAFIDTEYPGQKPDFKTIRKYLSTKMRLYWDNLVREGGGN